VSDTLPATASHLDLPRLLGDDQIGHEARAASGDRLSLKVWLRLLACSTQIETEIRKRLRARFGITLARFDYLAQLHRHPQGLRMNMLSRYLMVTGGNITGLTDELERDGLVTREDDPSDRRSFRLCLTEAGRQAFETIADAHEAWLADLCAGVDGTLMESLFQNLGQLRVQLAHNVSAANERGATA
jgi:DNA-binding MarR family transcriptional regulator